MDSNFDKTILQEPPRTKEINRLWNIQYAKGYFSDADATTLAKVYDLSEMEVEDVISTLISAFRLEPEVTHETKDSGF